VKHARLSASKAHRWLVCSGSANYPDGPPSYPAAEGTAMHEVGANALRLCQPVPASVATTVVDGYTIKFDKAMIDAVQFYVNTVNEDFQAGDELWIEMPLHSVLQTIDKDLGGTGDAVRYRPSDFSLRVFDAKFGSGTYVDADENKQMMLYGLGAMLSLGDRRVDTVWLTIVQPRFEGAIPVRNYIFKAVAILDFIADVQEAAVKTRKKNAPLAAGDHCKFCPAARTCPELEKRHHALVAQDFSNLPAVAPEKLAQALISIPLIKERIKAIEEYAYAEAQKGVEIPGYKLVDKRPVRRWKNEGDVIEWAQLREIAPYAPKELLSPAQLEKKIGKELKPQIAELIESKSSGTVLVSLEDDRPPAKRITADDFAAVETTADKKEAIPVSLF
jgi:hypothetical protein